MTLGCKTNYAIFFFFSILCCCCCYLRHGWWWRHARTHSQESRKWETVSNEAIAISYELAASVALMKLKIKSPTDIYRSLVCKYSKNSIKSSSRVEWRAHQWKKVIIHQMRKKTLTTKADRLQYSQSCTHIKEAKSKAEEGRLGLVEEVMAITCIDNIQQTLTAADDPQSCLQYRKRK